MVRNQKKISRKEKLNLRKTGLFILNFQVLLFYLFTNIPAKATTSEPILSVVHSQENANQWTGITNRLQSVGVKYCVIPLANVKSATDLGERKVLFLPNVETLTPTQAIAIEAWMSKGGRLIASGPVGSLSPPGVRQLLRALLGGYWGFSLSNVQKLQPSNTKLQQWATQNELFGQVRGGVVIPNNIATQTAAVWDAKDNPVAVMATERSTFFGWRWGVDAVASADVDKAWLQAVLNRYLKTSSTRENTAKVQGAAQNCATTVATAPTKRGAGELLSRGVGEKISPPVSNSQTQKLPSPSSVQQKTATAPQPIPIPNITPPKSEEAIDQLEQRVRLDVIPNSQTPISQREALALQQELENLIGRVESANLAATVNGNHSTAAKVESAFALTTSQVQVPTKQEVLAKAREVAKNLPQMIANKNYVQARQQWLMAKNSLWNQFPIDQKLAQPEIRAMWLDRGTIVRAKNEQGLAVIFDRMAQAGINTVFFETVNASYTIYPSQIAPAQNPLTRGWDPLAAAVKLAHERGMELHAWVWVFAAGNQRHNEILNIDSKYPGPVLAANPDWAGYDNRGQMIPPGQTKPFFDPANPQVRQYLLSLYEEIVTRYNVDGLQLDYIRYPFQDSSQGRTYGYGKAARAQFQQLHGVDPINISPSQSDLWRKWTEFRTQQVDSFVAAVSQLRQKQPNLILSVAVFPLPEQERIQKIQQHWEIWARRGDVDLIVPMTYALDTIRFDRLAQPWISSRQLGSSLLVPGIRLLSLPTVGAFDQIQLIRDLPVSGYALFATANLSNDLYKVFNSTQGSLSPAQKEPVPLRQPFQSAAVRYAALKKEWKFVLQNNQLQMSTATLADFNTQVDVLQTALNQLAESPTPTRLQGAKATLVRFQALFRTWMRQHSTSNPYQVKVWENRLTIIERLLRYGDRRK
ncbi:glycoside hydrolase family 10 protein [Iningainema tapete]|uniref:Family 10 glycosylhydrolase n=1 Tax=Iningainema tapete BLCC-T55 TaxID=2748662 RepID=A0A8J6XHX1_9CYAN|nr:family 10 glycosylhydrolase [Iningainema tapete]MBD2774668.1 family 10 glycosylhydrolase [Iningainema tapete BLCC-T55]